MMTVRRSSLVVHALVLLGFALGCGSSPPRPPDLGMNVSHPAGEATRPLLVEWPSSDRAELEALAARGLVAVHYVGSAMELLPNCKVSGHYLYAPLTRRHDRVTIRDASQLYAAIPIGAAKLEGRCAAQAS